MAVTPEVTVLGGYQPPERRESVIGGTKHGFGMEDYHVRCQVAAMLYVGGQVKSFKEALELANNMLQASKDYKN